MTLPSAPCTVYWYRAINKGSFQGVVTGRSRYIPARQSSGGKMNEQDQVAEADDTL